MTTLLPQPGTPGDAGGPSVAEADQARAGSVSTSLRDRVRALPASVWPLVAFAVLFLAGGLVESDLLSVSALIGTATFAAILTIASLGQTLAVIQAGIDLSVPNTIGFAALSFLTLVDRLGAVPAMVAAIAVGGVIGLVNGVIVAKLELTPIVTTIAMNGLLFGLILLTFNFSELTAVPDFVVAMTSQKVEVLGLGVPAVLLLALALVVVVQVALSWTGWGRSLFLVGASPEAARLAGLPVDRIRITGYVLSSAFAAFAGVVVVGYYQQATATMGASYLLSSVAAVVVGGASIFGGRGSVVGTLGGALILSQVATLVTVLNLGANVQQLIYGVIILVVIALYGRRPTA